MHKLETLRQEVTELRALTLRLAGLTLALGSALATAGGPPAAALRAELEELRALTARRPGD